MAGFVLNEQDFSNGNISFLLESTFSVLVEVVNTLESNASKRYHTNVELAYICAVNIIRLS